MAHASLDRNRLVAVDVDPGVYSEVPVTDRIVQVTVKVLYRALGTEAAKAIRGWIVLIVLVAVFTSELRSESRAGFWEIVLMVLLGMYLIAHGLIILRVRPTLERMIMGAPAFGPVGGLPGRLFFAMMRLSFEIRYVLRRDDWQRFKVYNEVDRDVTEELLKRSYFTHIEQEEAELDTSRLEERWQRYWTTRILGTGPGGRTFRDALDIENVGFRAEGFKLMTIVAVGSQLFDLMFVVMVVLLYLHLAEMIGFITMIQLGLPLLLIGPFFVFMLHAHRHERFPLGGISVPLPDDLNAEIGARLEGITGSMIRPVRVKVGKRYTKIVRDFLGPLVALGTLLSAASFLTFIGITLALGYMLPGIEVGNTTEWYRDLAAGVLLIALAVPVAFYISFWVLRNVRQIVAPVVIALLVAGLPYAVQFVTSGELRFDEAINRFLGASGVVVTAVVEAISSRLRKATEESDKDMEDAPLLEVVD
jgi:hypothetical protein